MYMAALPCPPMPLLVKQEMDDEDEDYPSECYKNSHDLISSLLLIAMHHGDTQLTRPHRRLLTLHTRQYSARPPKVYYLVP